MKMNSSALFRLEKAMEIELYEALKRHDKTTYNIVLYTLSTLYISAGYTEDEDLNSLINEIERTVASHLFEEAE